jgi:hypothetical protein
MTITALPSDIKNTGLNQDSLVTLLGNYNAVINELKDDHATFKTVVTDVKTAVNAVITAANSGSFAAIAAVTPVTSSSPATLSNATDLTLLKG